MLVFGVLLMGVLMMVIRSRGGMTVPACSFGDMKIAMGVGGRVPVAPAQPNPSSEQEQVHGRQEAIEGTDLMMVSIMVMVVPE